jgi:uncharacterized membrane protein
VAPSADENPAPPLVPPTTPRKRQVSFGEDFRRFFLSGMAALLPTLITLWLLVWAWNFLWESLGQHIIVAISLIWEALSNAGMVEFTSRGAIGRFWSQHPVLERLLGVLLAVLLVYFIGVIVGNFIGRTFYRLIEAAVMRIPLVRAVYPAVKQVTDFLLANRRDEFSASRVVAVQPHEQGIWSVGLLTGGGLKPLNALVGEDLVTVFVPSTPTAFSGYVLVVPRRNVVELPMTVEEAMRLLVSGGVIVPDPPRGMVTAPVPAPAPAPESASALPKQLGQLQQPQQPDTLSLAATTSSSSAAATINDSIVNEPPSANPQTAR